MLLQPKLNSKTFKKLWVTKGTQTSSKQRDKLHKEAIKEKDSQKKIQKHEAYTKNQNEIKDLLKVSKQTHFKKYFEDKRNCKALSWHSSTNSVLLKISMTF